MARGNRSKRIGNQGEEIAAMQLRMLGVNMVETIYTGWRVVRWVNRPKRVAIIVPYEKVSGDLRGVLPDGRSVLVEVKTYDGDTLAHSKLKPHQVAALQEHYDNFGVSLLVWVNRGNVFVMAWPIEGFKKGKSIHYLDAQTHTWKGFPGRA